jgi:chemotaxis protein histidine kinase CheA
MLIVKSPPKLGSTLDDLVLRVRGTSHDGQVIRLRSSKCTIGSASDCTLRLMARGVQPMHCLILRGNRGTLVRRCSSDTLLNGQGFADAALVPGDRLGIGPIELEVLDPNRSSAEQSPRHPGPDAAPAIAARASRDPSLAVPEQIDAPRAKLEQQQDPGRSRGEGNQQRAEIEQRAAHEQDQLQTRWKELQATSQAFAEERQLWQAQRREMEEQLAQKAAELEVKGAALETQRLAMEQERQRCEAARSENGLESSQQAESLNARRMELDERRKAMDQKQRALDTERRQWEMQCRQSEQSRQAELDSLRAELANVRRMLEDQLASKACADVPLETPQRLEITCAGDASPALAADAEEPRDGGDDLGRVLRSGVAEQAALAAPPAIPARSSKEPVNLNEVFRSLGITPPGDEDSLPPQLSVTLHSPLAPPAGDESVEEEPPRLASRSSNSGDTVGQADHGTRNFSLAGAPVPEAEPALGRPPVPERSHSNATGTAHEADGEEESIHEYMTRLLQRVGASPEAIQRQNQPKQPSQPSAAAAGASPAKAVPEGPANPADHKPLKRLPARAAAPEKMVPLSAMRELANLQAETAITRYARSRARRTAASKLVLTVIAALSGSILLLFCRQTGDQLTLYAAAASLVTALWSGQYVLQSRRPARWPTRRPTGRKEPLERLLSPDDFSADALAPPKTAGVMQDWPGLLDGMGPPVEKDER